MLYSLSLNYTTFLEMRTAIMIITVTCILVMSGALFYTMYITYKNKYATPTANPSLPPTSSPTAKYPYIPHPSNGSTSSTHYDDIPKIVYQTWSTHTLPPIMKETHDKFKADNPEFQYILFDDDESREFIRAHFDTGVLNAYDSLLPGAFKADLWRYCVLYVNGGVYLDIKYALVDPFFFHLIDLFDKEKYPLPMVVETSPLYVYTGLLMTPPANPLYAECIRRIVENVESEYYGNSPMAPTGPELFGGLIEETDKQRAVLFYYDDYFLKEGEDEKRAKYHKRGFIKDMRDEKDVLCHYLDYRVEQAEHSKTGYWMNMWRSREIYAKTGDSVVSSCSR